MHPEVGHVEMDPDVLWKSFIAVVKGAVQGTAAQHFVNTSTCNCTKRLDWMEFMLYVK